MHTTKKSHLTFLFPQRYISDIYTKISNGFIFVFDVSQRNSLKDVERFFSAVKECRDIENVPKILVGNKIDLPRQISREEAEEYAESLKCDYFDVSAKDFTNIAPAFQHIAKLVVSAHVEQEKDGRNDKKKRFICTLL